MDEAENEAAAAAAAAATPDRRPTQFARSLGPAWVETAPGIFRRTDEFDSHRNASRSEPGVPPEAA